MGEKKAICAIFVCEKMMKNCIKFVSRHYEVLPPFHLIMCQHDWVCEGFRKCQKR